MFLYDLLVITGPTASGKTELAAHLAARLDGEVISVDSRQVYRGMDIGTGKDYSDYLVDDVRIPFHLIDIADPGYQYNLFEYQRDYFRVLTDLLQRGKFPVLCGGSGLYLDAVLKNYRLVQVPFNENLRASLAGKNLVELTEILRQYKSRLHNITDIVTVKRALRAIEIEDYYSSHPSADPGLPYLKPLVTGILYDLHTRRERITTRLHQRMKEGLVEEVKKLLDSGIHPEELIYYGLEYKFVTLFLTGELSLQEMTDKLNIAIHQFAKRQMTWFRKMEREGMEIFWLDGNLSLNNKIDQVIRLLRTGRNNSEDDLCQTSGE